MSGNQCETNIEPTCTVAAIAKSAFGESSIQYEQKNYILKIKLTTNAEKCGNCAGLASEYEIQKFVNGILESISYNCKSCLFDKIIPAYRDQGAKIDIIAPEPPEEAS